MPDPYYCRCSFEERHKCSLHRAAPYLFEALETAIIAAKKMLPDFDFKEFEAVLKQAKDE